MISSAIAHAEPPLDANVRALVDRWLDAQNKGDFAAYERLYAPTFEGVRRSGYRTRKFDRAGWMADRARMFQKPIRVTIKNEAQQATGAALLVVTFYQQWSNDNYKDAGAKQLMVTRGANPLIVREELLASERDITRPVSPSTPKFAWVLHGGVVLSTKPARAWGTGPRQVTDADGATIITQTVDLAKIPTELAAWRGRKMTAVNGDGSTCAASITGLRLFSRATYMDGWLSWMMRDAKMSRVDVIEQIASEDGGTILLGALDQPCEQAVWARAAEETAPKIFVAKDLDDAKLRKRALDATHALAEYAAAKKLAVSTARFWEEEPEHGSVQVVVMRAEEHGTPVTLLSVTASNSDGGDSVDLWALFEERAGKLVLRNKPVIPLSIVPSFAADLDGDGELELVEKRLVPEKKQPANGEHVFPSDFTESRMIRGPGFVTEERIPVPYSGCRL